MVGVIVLTHGALAPELLRTAEGIVGPIEGARPVSISPTASLDAIREELARVMAEVDTGEGVLVLTDMFGGTPANMALSFMGQRRVEVVTGCNLPMLLKLATVRDGAANLHDVAQAITAYGQKNITFASDLLVRPTAAPAGTRHDGNARH
ncbi:MAG: PTS sugar transporter subunit IIA [Myxococcales bacterium]